MLVQGPEASMLRREFIALLGGASAGWPLAAYAQKPAMPEIGFLSSVTAGPFAGELAGFKKGLAESGFVEGQNLLAHLCTLGSKGVANIVRCR